MKKIFLIVTAVIFCLNISAQSNVEVFSQNGEKFWVIINGIKQNDAPQTNVKVTGLKDPRYTFKIIFNDESLPAIDDNIYTQNYEGQYANLSYVIKKNNKGKYVLRMNSFSESTASNPNQYSTPLSLEEKPSTNTQTTTTQPTTTTQTTTVNTTTSASPTGMNVQVNDPEMGVNFNMNMNVPGVSTTGTTSTTTVTTTTTTSSSTSGVSTTPTNPAIGQPVPVETKPRYNLPGYSGPIGCPYPMSDTEFNSAKSSITSKSFEDSKITIAKQIIGNNCLLCTQVKEILKLFSFEDSKLQIAKFAYNKTFDIGNYYKLNDAFTFESSIDELNEYISTQKK